MPRRAGRFRRKTRSKLRKRIRQKGKIHMQRYFHQFKIGERVQLKAEPAIQKGMYFPKFHGKYGTVKNKKGKCFEILIKDKKKEKTLFVHPVHLKKV